MPGTFCVACIMHARHIVIGSVSASILYTPYRRHLYLSNCHVVSNIDYILILVPTYTVYTRHTRTLVKYLNINVLKCHLIQVLPASYPYPYPGPSRFLSLSRSFPLLILIQVLPASFLHFLYIFSFWFIDSYDWATDLYLNVSLLFVLFFMYNGVLLLMTK